MPRVRHLIASLTLAVTLFIAGCSDLPTAPTVEVEDPSYLLQGVIGSLGLQNDQSEEVTVLERSRPLDQDEVQSRWIGPRGGVIYLREAGLTVQFPPEAVDRWTRVTVTAPEGDLVGYHFAPHGLEFDRPVVVIQDMLKTEGLGLGGLSAVYFDGDLGSTVSPLERLSLEILGSLGVFRVEHFSGYVIATN